MQKLLDKEEVMEKKNVLMQPIFRDIKSAIRFMTNTEEHKLLKEYAKLLRRQRLQIEKDPSKKLRML